MVRPEMYQAPEVYIAKTPPGGIPALSQATATGTGTGTDTTDTPGYANCDIYRIQLYGDVPELEPVGGLFRRVYNVAGDLVPGNQWIVVVRDKFGSWLVVAPGPEAGSAGTGTGGDSTVRHLVRLKNKIYTVGEFIRYEADYVTDSTSPSPLTYAIGAPVAEAIYEVNDNDLAVPTITYIRPGAGSWWLIDEQPLWDFVEKTGAQFAGYFPGNRIRYDQSSNTVVARYAIKITDLNGLP